jgi:hypothetical protein
MTRSGRSAVTVLAIVIGIATVVVVLLASIRRAPETYPWGDTAATSIYTLRAATDGLGVGSYSRFHWNHPGPLLYEFLAPLYALSGYREISIKWTTLILNICALTTLLFVVRRRAPVLAVTIAIALLPLLYREQRLLFWAWNPIVPLLPLALAVALSAGVAAGGVRLLPLLFAVTSLMVQAHVAFAPVTLAMLATSFALLAWRIQHGQCAPARRDVRRSVTLSVLILAGAWAVPIAHELAHSPGNLAAIANFFLTTPHEPRAWSTILAVFANQLVGPLAPSWELTTAAASDAVSWPVLMIALAQFPLLIVAAVRASRRGASFEASFATIAIVISTVGVMAVRSIVGPVSDYLITWIAVIGALNVAMIAAEVVHALRLSISASRAWRWALIAYLASVALMGSVRLTSKHAYDARSSVIRTLTERLDGYSRANGIDRPLLRFSLAGWEGAAGVLLQYYKQRKPIAVSDDLLYLVGDPFTANGGEAGEFYLMLGTEAAIPEGVTRHEWLTTYGSFRLIRLFRTSSAIAQVQQ